MKTIRKGIEPSSLTQHRLSGADANYEAYREKPALRDALATEQRGLCCYCLSNIRSSVASMKIEHWHSRSKYPNEQLDYGNLLGACKGNDGGPPHYHHCDTKKKNTELSRNPSNPNHHVEDLVRFGNRGEIRSLDDRFNDELNLVLTSISPGLGANV